MLILKLEAKLEVVVENLGGKKVQVELDTDQLDLRSGKVVA
jgi:hypothetical protein